jgi:hypothetical protein
MLIAKRRAMFCQKYGESGAVTLKDSITAMTRPAIADVSSGIASWAKADSYVGPGAKIYRTHSPRLRFLMYSSLNVDTEKLGKRGRCHSAREDGTFAWQCRRE